MVQPTNEFAEAALDAMEAEGFDVENPDTPIPPLRVCREGYRCTRAESEAAWGNGGDGCVFCFSFSVFDKITDDQIEYECSERLHS